MAPVVAYADQVYGLWIVGHGAKRPDLLVFSVPGAYHSNNDFGRNFEMLETRCEGIVMDGSLKGQRLAHDSAHYKREHMEGLNTLVSGLDGPLPFRWTETYVFVDGSDKRRLPGWYLQ